MLSSRKPYHLSLVSVILFSTLLFISIIFHSTQSDTSLFHGAACYHVGGIKTSYTPNVCTWHWTPGSYMEDSTGYEKPMHPKDREEARLDAEVKAVIDARFEAQFEAKAQKLNLRRRRRIRLVTLRGLTPDLGRSTISAIPNNVRPWTFFGLPLYTFHQWLQQETIDSLLLTIIHHIHILCCQGGKSTMLLQ